MTDKVPFRAPQEPQETPPVRAFPPGFKHEEVLVTPEMARRYLETMHVNRSKSRVEIDVMADNLTEGEFYPEISPVFFDGADRAYDGQHRFRAIVNTGLPAWMLFVRGVREEAAEYIDTGRRRTYADSQKINGVVSFKQQSTLARALALYAKYGLAGIRNPSGYAVTRSEMDKWVDAPGMLEAIRKADGLYRTLGSNPTVAAYAIMRTGIGMDPDGFWETVRSGDNLVKNDPAKTLRDWIMKGRRTDGRAKADPRLMNLFAFTTTWNKHVLGQSYQKVSPSFERKGPRGDLVFPAANVPDFLALDPAERARQLKELRDAYGHLKSLRQVTGDDEQQET